MKVRRSNLHSCYFIWQEICAQFFSFNCFLTSSFFIGNVTTSISHLHFYSLYCVILLLVFNRKLNSIQRLTDDFSCIDTTIPQHWANISGNCKTKKSIMSPHYKYSNMPSHTPTSVKGASFASGRSFPSSLLTRTNLSTPEQNLSAHVGTLRNSICINSNVCNICCNSSFANSSLLRVYNIDWLMLCAYYNNVLCFFCITQGTWPPMSCSWC